MWSAFSLDIPAPSSVGVGWRQAVGPRSFWPARRSLAALGARLDALAYSGTGTRDLRVDVLRGLAVVVMVVDHLAGPSPLQVVTGGNHFFTSAAEAFVFLSGLVAGVVSRRGVDSHGIGAACRRLLTRAWTLWALAVGLGVVVVPLASTLGLPGGGRTVHLDATLVWTIATLQQTGYLVDVPVLYALLLAIAPLALVLLHERRAWCVLLISFVLWAGYQQFPDRTNIPWPIAGNELFHFAAWQLLFFVGLALGFHRDAIARVFPQNWRRPILAVVVVALVGLVLACTRLDTALRAIQAAPSISAAGESAQALRIEELLFSKSDLRPGRLFATAVTLGGLYLLATEFWVPVRRAVGWLLLPLGQNALYAYSAHVVLALVAAVAMSASGANSPLTNAAIQVVSVAAIWIGIRLGFLYPRATSSVRIWLPIAMLLGAACLFQFAPLNRLENHTHNASASMTALPTGSDALARAFGTPVTRLPDNHDAPGAGSSVETNATPPPSATPGPRRVAVGDAEDRKSDVAGTFAAAIQQIIAGTFREDVLDSVVLGRKNSYYVYLPPDYAQSARRYPVLYLLHGGGGSKDEWPAYGAVTTLDRLITSGAIQPMILVLPQGDKGYWVDAADGGPRWGEYTSQELLVNVDTRYRTQPNGDHRAIGGLSMGGAGALQLAFNHPDLFHTVGAHSPSLHLDDGTFPLFGTGADFDAREPLRLALLAPNIDALTIWIDAGGDDPWLPRDTQLHQSLIDRGIAHTWTVLPGGHEGPYWKRNIERYLRFYAGAFTAADSHS